MDPKTLAAITFYEQLAGLVVKGFVDIKNLLSGSGGQTADQILADADATYQQIIDNAKAYSQNPPADQTKIVR